MTDCYNPHCTCSVRCTVPHPFPHCLSLPLPSLSFSNLPITPSPPFSPPSLSISVFLSFLFLYLPSLSLCLPPHVLSHPACTLRISMVNLTVGWVAVWRRQLKLLELMETHQRSPGSYRNKKYDQCTLLGGGNRCIFYSFFYTSILHCIIYCWPQYGTCIHVHVRVIRP